jgi:hypothetical protein
LEVTFAREVKQHSIAVRSIITMVGGCPLGRGEATYAVTVLDLKQTDGRATVVTVGVEVFVFPPVL